ncbi:MAG: LysR family transcriptional regulator [Granulosicoccaceae bacterium]
MSIALLKTLIAVAEDGSFSAAADRVCVSQAAVGQQMRRLESQLGVVLFDRSQKTPHLNQLGKALVPKALKVVRAYDTILDDLTGDARLIGELNLGAVPSTIRGLIPMSIKQLVADCPDLHIRVVPELSGELLAQVERGAIDAAVLSKPAHDSKHLNWTPFVDEELVLLTSPEVSDNDPFKIMRERPYIRHTRRAAVGILAEEWLVQNKVAVSESMELGSLETISSMISHNLGVSVVPNICVPDPIFTSLRKISLGPNSPCRSLGILTRADCSKVLLVERLLSKIVQIVKQHQVADPE